MISITNISKDDAPTLGINEYEVKVNQTHICFFQHKRKFNGLADCLRNAADAIEKKQNEDHSEKIDKLLAEISKGDAGIFSHLK